jgi:hypothetical protein
VLPCLLPCAADLEGNNGTATLGGNSDASTIVTNTFATTVRARYWRVIPFNGLSGAWHMRVEFFGTEVYQAAVAPHSVPTAVMQ